MRDQKKGTGSESVRNSEMDRYITQWPKEIRIIMTNTRALIHETVPGVTEHMSWDMPTFKWQGKNLCHFAGNKAHLGFYPGPRAIEALQKELSDYKTSKGAVQFRYEEAIPYGLMQRIILAAKSFLDQASEERAETKRRKKAQEKSRRDLSPPKEAEEDPGKPGTWRIGGKADPQG